MAIDILSHEANMAKNQALPSSQSSSLFPARFSKILVAVDGSEKSLYAAKYAIVLARKDDAEVIALTVAILPAPNYLGPSLIEEWRNHAMIEAELLFDKIRTFVIENSKSNNGKQTKFKTELLESQLSAEAAIVNYADNQDVDLVVLGTKGKSGLKRCCLEVLHREWLLMHQSQCWW
jgi:nucleotide-binding universal stress UspA family protein